MCERANGVTLVRKGPQRCTALAMQIKCGSDEGRTGDWADITFGFIGFRQQRALDSRSFDRSPMETRAFNPAASNSRSTFVPSVLSFEKRISPPAFVHRWNARTQNVTMFLSIKKSRKDRVIRENRRKLSTIEC